MLVYKTHYITFFLLMFFTANVVAVEPTKVVLNEHEVINSEIKGTEKHRYHLALTNAQFAEFRLVQKGVDLMITTFDAQGKKIEVFDLTSNFGEELATITADIAGDYMIEVQPFTDTNNAAHYSIELKQLSEKAETPSEKVDQYLAHWDSATSPGVAISVVKNGEIIHSNGFGLANLEYDSPITSKTVFDVASISKQFTAFSIMLLADEGKLSIDDEVGKYLPELSSFEHKITLRHLLHHTSGLREQDVLREAAGWSSDDIATQRQAFKLLTMQNNLNFEPGETFEYSNSGYFLLANVVSRVSGQSFEMFTKNRIFKPLGMSNSAFPSDYQTIIKNKAYSYKISKNGFVKSILNSNMIGSTGLTTTVEDLAKWATNFEQPTVGNHTIINQMKRTGVFNNGETTNYAFGQVIDSYRGMETIGHGGTMAGFRTYLLRIPSQKLSVVVLANLSALNPLNIAYEIAAFYLSDVSNTILIPKPLSKEVLTSFTGDFEVLGGLRYTITQEDHKLYLQIMGGGKQLLTHLVNNEFSFGTEGRKLRFGADKKANINKIILVEGIYGGGVVEGKRITLPSININDIDLSEFTGRFYSQELETAYDVILENNQLKAINLRKEVNLTPYNKDIFTGNIGAFLKVSFTRNKESEITGFETSGTLINKLQFIKEM